LLVCSRAANPDATLTSQGSRGSGATRGCGPQDPVVDAAHGGGDLAPKLDSAAGVASASVAPPMTELAA
jgi:hypothetical protein